MGRPAATPDPASPADRGDDRHAPFGLPVLADVPELAGLLQLAVDAERTTARLIECIIVLEEHDLAARTTGVPLDQWLAIVARSTGADRRMLRTAARVCRRLPALRAALADGRSSWSQVRAVALKVDRLPRHLDPHLDDELAAAIDGAEGADPDALARIVTWTVASLEASDDAPERTSTADDVLVLQPRLDGSGGRGWFDLGPIGFAAVDAATDPGPTGTASRRAFGAPVDPDVAAINRTTAGKARAARLIDVCRRGGPGRQAPRPPALLLRAELETILGDDRLPAQLLTTLAGGTMHVDRRTAQRLADEHGTDLRLVLLDDGDVVGVGTRTRQPPGWLADAIAALHDTCCEPGCNVAARVCDLDHAVPVAAGGATDVRQLAPLCATGNHRKEADGWTADQTADGIRSWHHRRTGLSTRTLPATWRPPDRRAGPAEPTPAPPDPPAPPGDPPFPF